MATNYAAIGLPEFLFWQVIQAIGQSNYVIGTSQLFCPNQSEDYVYYCWFQSSCDLIQDQSWWNSWVFKFKFAGTNQYVMIPLADLAYSRNGRCYLAFSRLDMDVLTNSDQIILGASFLQQFNALFWYNYTAGTTTLSLTQSPNNTLSGFYLGNFNYTVEP